MTVGIEHARTAAANDMVMIVPRPRLVKRGLTLGLDFPDDPAFNKRIEVVINSLF